MDLFFGTCRDGYQRCGFSEATAGAAARGWEDELLRVVCQQMEPRRWGTNHNVCGVRKRTGLVTDEHL